MKSRRTSLLILCIALSSLSAYPQEKSSGVEIVRPQDLKRTAYRLHITVDRLVNARAALKEATDLALRADSDEMNDYGYFGSLAGLWIQIDRKKARETIGSMIFDLSSHAQAAETLDLYRSYTNRAQQLLSSLNEVDPEHAQQIAQLWPAPSAKFGSPGEQALAQFQSELMNRLISQSVYSSPDLVYEQLQQPQKASTLPLALRIQVAQSLINSNQKDKARAVLDQAIVDMGKRTVAPGQRYDYEGFLSGLARLYPDRMLEAFDAYQQMLAGQGPDANQGTIMQSGEQRVWLSAAETSVLNVVRGLYNRPELALKLLDSVPGIRSKFDQLGGLDNVLSSGRGGLSPGSQVLSYSAASSDMARIAAANAPARPDGSVESDAPPNPNQLFQSLRGKAEDNPGMVRRKLEDAYRKKEHFSSLISLAQIANYPDPDLSSIALQVARGLLPQFDNLQQRAASFRDLISATRTCEGEVDPGLLKQGMSLARDLREEEKDNEQANPQPQNARAYRQSDDFETALIGQMAVSDFSEALRTARAMESDSLRVRVLVQMAQSLLANY